MEEMMEVGVIGIVLYGAFLVGCIYRTYRYWEVTKGEKDLKFRFHVLLLINVALELMYFVSFVVEKRYSMWGYQFHLASLLFHVLSHSVVLVLWAKALTVSGRAYNVLWRFILFLAVGFACATVVNSVYLFYMGNFDRYLSGQTEIYTSLWVAETIILLVFTLWMLVYVLRVKQEVKSSLEKEAAEDVSLKRSLWRINTVVAACVIAAVLRLLALCLIIVVSNFHFHELQWFIYSNWIPTIIPSIVLLFVTRPNPNLEEEEEDVANDFADEEQSSQAVSSTTASTNMHYYSSDRESIDAASADGDPRRSRFSSHIDHHESTALSNELLFSNKALSFLRDSNLQEGTDFRASQSRNSRHSRKIEFDSRNADGSAKRSNALVVEGRNPMFGGGDAL